MAFVASVVLLAMETTVQTSTDSAEQTIAEGMARQLLDEALSKRYMTPGGNPYQYPLSASWWEQAGSGRQRFDDTDDFNGFVAEGAEDLWGEPLGEGDDQGGTRNPAFEVPANYFSRWRQQIRVYYVDADDFTSRLPAFNTSNYRAVEVTISKREPDGTLRTLANLRRVYSYVPEPP